MRLRLSQLHKIIAEEVSRTLAESKVSHLRRVIAEEVERSLRESAGEDFTSQQIAQDIIHSGLLADHGGDAEDAVDAYLGSTDRESVLNPDEIVRAVWDELRELKGGALPTSYPLRVVEYTNARGEKRTIETQRPLQTLRRLTFTGLPDARVVS